MANEVLIIDASKAEGFFLGGLLRKLGADVTQARDEREAEDILKEKGFQIVFIDERLKGTDGYQVYDSLRLRKLLTDTQTVFVGEGRKDDSDIVLHRPIKYRRLSEILQGSFSIEQRKGHIEGIPDWLAQVRELDHESAIKNCGSAEGYLAALEIFAYTIKEKSDEIERLFDEGNIKDYTIKVHALKSSSLIVGAKELSELAKSLELAGKDGDAAFIDKETGRLLEMYRRYDGLLAPMTGRDAAEDEGSPGDEKELADPEILEDAYSSIGSFADEMDIDLVEMVLESLKDYSMPTEDAKKIEQIKKYAFDLDWDGIRSVVYGGGE